MTDDLDPRQHEPFGGRGRSHADIRAETEAIGRSYDRRERIKWACSAIVLTWLLVAYLTAPPSPRTEYVAVLLTNGNTLYGHLSGMGDKFPVMTDVFTIATDPVAGAQTLVPRANDLHSPTRTILNATQVVTVESVAANSQVGKLIRAQK